jgi:hypothetical protein
VVLHTDNSDDNRAVGVYERTGFELVRVFDAGRGRKMSEFQFRLPPAFRASEIRT